MTKQNKEPLRLINNNLVLATPNNYILSIQLSLDGFSFCIYNNFDNCLETLQNHSFNAIGPEALLYEIEKIFAFEPLLNKDFNKVTVSHINNLSTLVPKSLFDKKHLKNYLDYSVKTLENDFFDFDELELINAVNVYIPFVNVNNYFIDKFGSFTFNHFSTLLIQQLIAQNNLNNKTQLFAHISKTHFEIIAIEGQKLLLYNTFTYQTKEDFIYYILFVTEQLGLNPNSLNLLLLGDITSTDKLFAIAYKYIKNVKLYNFSLKYKPMFNLSDAQQRQFFCLLHQH